MNTVTKVFIVLNMIIAVVAGGVVATFYAYQENYKRRWDVDTEKLASSLKRQSELTLDESYKKMENWTLYQNSFDRVQSLQSEKAELENQIKLLQSEKASLSTTIDQLTIEKLSQQQTITQLQDSLRNSEKRKRELNHIATVARGVAFELNVKLAEVEDDLNNAMAELTRRERTIYELEQETKRKDALLALVRTQHREVWKIINDQAGGTSATVVNAVVAAVKINPQGQQDLVMLTVGRDDEVTEGMEFIIYRGNQYVVKVRAERVMNDMVACRVIPDTWNAKDIPVQPGDLATNRLF